MNVRRIAGALALVVAAVLLGPPGLQAICEDDFGCYAPYSQCVNNQCINPNCPPPPPPSSTCIPSGGVDDVLFGTNCCSGNAVPGSTCCRYSWDWGGSWSSCSQICG